jgi:hypothetical protein
VRYLNDQPLDLTQRLPTLENLEATGSGESVAMRA